jgi:hypothetical protein
MVQQKIVDIHLKVWNVVEGDDACRTAFITLLKVNVVRENVTRIGFECIILAQLLNIPEISGTFCTKTSLILH